MTDCRADGRLSRLGALAAALASIVFAMSGARSQAAIISVIPGPDGAIVSVDGQLINDDGDQFREKTKALEPISKSPAAVDPL
jgi:hypothetical protein